jgi:microcin C transport system permease protein
MDTPAVVPVAIPIKPPRKGLLSPPNLRRWENFRANRRGYWSFWLFLLLFILSMGAEFLANDRPIVASYKGEILFPIFVNYQEDKFGGFLAETDYRSSYISDEINANGWMIWPPIRYSYQTVNSNIPHSAPTPPFWLMSAEERCSAYPLKTADPGCSLGNLNWLGTDDQARDVMARMIYGFRVSVLFGLALTICSARGRRHCRRRPGLFRRLDRSLAAALHRDLVVDAGALYPAHHRLHLPPGFFILLGIMLLFSWVGFVGIVRAEFLRARNFEYVRAARALGVNNRTIMVRHLLPNAMVATLTFLPFILGPARSPP